MQGNYISYRTERPRLSTMMSDLSLGTGKITQSANTNQVELQLSPRDYTSMVTHRTRPHDLFSLIQTDGDQHSPRKGTSNIDKGPAVILPKTYVTRSGSLFLYSDSNVMKDNQETSNEGRVKTLPISVHGHAISKPSRLTESCPNWGHLLSHKSKTSSGKVGKMSPRERFHYLGVTRNQCLPPSYLWNYAVKPAKVIDVTRNDDLKTVHNLSEAILTYSHCIPTGSDIDRNESAVDIRSMIVQQSAMTSRPDTRLSSWTRAWLNTEDLMSINCKSRAKSARKANTVIDPHWYDLERARTSLTMHSETVDRAPANTPLSMVQCSTRSRQKVVRRVKSSVSRVSVTFPRNISSPSCGSFNGDLDTEITK